MGIKFPFDIKLVEGQVLRIDGANAGSGFGGSIAIMDRTGSGWKLRQPPGVISVRYGKACLTKDDLAQMLRFAAELPSVFAFVGVPDILIVAANGLEI